MGGEQVKQRPRKNGEQAPLKPAEDVKTLCPDQTEKDDKVGESSAETSESAQELGSEPGDLPDSYGETRIVLLPVEPYVLHVYWEVTFVELEKAKYRLGDKYRRSEAILRFYDVTNIIFDGTNAHGSFDVHIDLQAKNWYVHLWSPEKSYFVEVGFKTEDSRFFPLARSNITQTPRVWPAPRGDERYMLVAGDYDLLETVPSPSDRQSSYSLTPPTASGAEPELPSAAGGNRYLQTRCPSAPEENSSRAEVHEEHFCDDRIQAGVGEAAEMQGAEPVSEFKPEAPSRHKEERALDLTELSEKSFTSGVSSK